SLFSSPYKSSTQNVKSKCWDLCPNYHDLQSWGTGGCREGMAGCSLESRMAGDQWTAFTRLTSEASVIK
ncbi:hypothetical protein QR685DRAFT_444078, partial [Neurospora intermedia]